MSSDDEVARLRVRIGELEDRLDFLYKRLGVEYVESRSGIDPQIVEFLKKRNKIQAIKRYQELYNSGLAEAKKAVDDIEARLSL
jgi:ribosomal protein L7/L12